MRRIDEKHEVTAPHLLPNLRVVSLLLELARSDDVDFARFSEAAEAETVISSRILREASAITAGRHSQIEEVQHAMAMLGIRRVRGILEKLRAHAEQTISHKPHIVSASNSRDTSAEAGSVIADGTTKGAEQ